MNSGANLLRNNRTHSAPLGTHRHLRSIAWLNSEQQRIKLWGMGEEAVGYHQSQQFLNAAHGQQARTQGPSECGIHELMTAEQQRTMPFPSAVLISERELEKEREAGGGGSHMTKEYRGNTIRQPSKEASVLSLGPFSFSMQSFGKLPLQRGLVEKSQCLCRETEVV